MVEEPDNILLELIEDGHAAAIGAIVAVMARLEAVVDGALWALAGLEDTPEIGACLTAQITSVRQRFDALISLAQVRGATPSALKKLKCAKEEAIRLGERRNRFVHDTWHYALEQKQHYQLEVTAKSGLRFLYRPVAEADLQRLIEDVKGAINRFPAAVYETLAIVQPWLEKPPL